MINFSHGKENFGSPSSYVIRKFPSPGPDERYYYNKWLELLKEKECHWLKTKDDKANKHRKKKSRVYNNTKSAAKNDENSPSKLVMHQVQIDPNLYQSDENLSIENRKAPPPTHMKEGKP